MGFAGIMKDLIDDNYFGLSTGWSVPRPEIKWSDEGKKIKEKAIRVTKNDVVNQTDTIKFWKQAKGEIFDSSQERYLTAWKEENERRMNELYYVFNHITTSEIKAVIEIAIKDLQEANNNIAQILNARMDSFYDTNGLIDPSGGYIREFSDELLTQILKRIECSILGESIAEWVHDRLFTW